MKHVSALIFPATEPSYHILSRFLIFFKTLSCYRVMEPEEAGNNDDNLFPGLYSGYTPAPLGKDLLRFKRLLQEMETGRADEFARLFSIAKAPMAGGRLRDRDETSSAGIFSALHRDDDTEKSIRHQEDLWQARLILKLAEMFDRKEDEVRQGLEQISAAERKVFASLEGPGDNNAGTAEELPAPDKQQHPHINHILPAGAAAAPAQTLIPIRLKAWARLYLEDNSDRLAIILAAQGSQSGSILLDGYENIWRKEPLKLFSLPLPDSLHPDSIKNPDHYLMARNTFREEIRDH
ncbi:MAG: hypothetical protein R3297_09985, partial [Desulfobulbales bacterium]|nr:hypothetical protein [Desulfobulbales bacterium]